MRNPRAQFEAGIARRVINPPPGVELAGLGYYLNRTWQRVRDNLNATALVVGDGDQCVAWVALDLMYNDARFTRRVRKLAAAQTDLLPEATCVNFFHSHNAPTARLLLGGGERDEAYLDFAAREATRAVIE